MDNLQFSLENMFSTFGSSPSKIDVSSESGEEFTVEPGDMQVINDRFRIGTPRSDVMSAFLRAAAFPPTALPQQSAEVTSGSRIERHDLIGEHQGSQTISPSSFVDTEFGDSPQSPDEQEMIQDVPMNSFGKPSESILQTPKGRDSTITHHDGIHCGHKTLCMGLKQ